MECWSSEGKCEACWSSAGGDGLGGCRLGALHLYQSFPLGTVLWHSYQRADTLLENNLLVEGIIQTLCF